MLMPKRVKYRKQMRGRMKGKESRGVEISFGEFGLQGQRLQKVILVTEGGDPPADLDVGEAREPAGALLGDKNGLGPRSGRGIDLADRGQPARAEVEVAADLFGRGPLLPARALSDEDVGDGGAFGTGAESRGKNDRRGDDPGRTFP